MNLPFKYVKPQLCVLVEGPPEGDRWVHEPKLDGYHIQLHVMSGEVRLYSRNGLDWTHRFPEIAEAAGGLNDCIIDGEICAVKDGLPTFAGLTDALTAKSTRLVYYVFDMLLDAGGDLANQPLNKRKAKLNTAVRRLTACKFRRFCFVEHQAAPNGSAAIHQEACKAGLEGIVSAERLHL